MKKSYCFVLCLLLASIFLFSCSPKKRFDEPEVFSPDSLIKKLKSFDKKEFWEGLKRKGFQRCAIFDADGTLWKGDISSSIIKRDFQSKSLSEKGLPALNDLLAFFGFQPVKTVYEAKEKMSEAFRKGYNKGGLYYIGERLKPNLNKDQVHEKVWNHYNLYYVGLSPKEMQKRAGDYLKSGFHKNRFRGMQEIVDYLRETGFKTYVISAGVHDFSLTGAKTFGFDEYNVRGMKLKVKEGVITGEADFPITYKDGKAELAEKFCGGKPFIVFGDSVLGTDEKMLEKAYFPVAVEPKPEYVKVAIDKKYSILDFNETVGGESADRFKVDLKSKIGGEIELDGVVHNTKDGAYLDQYVINDFQVPDSVTGKKIRLKGLLKDIVEISESSKVDGVISQGREGTSVHLIISDVEWQLVE